MFTLFISIYTELKAKSNEVLSVQTYHNDVCVFEVSTILKPLQHCDLCSAQ